MTPDEVLALLRRYARNEIVIENLMEQNRLLREKVAALEAEKADESSNLG